METFRINILNPKVKILLQNLADLNLIRIEDDKIKPELQELLEKMRAMEEDTPSLEEITSEVEAVRKKRYEK